MWLRKRRPMLPLALALLIGLAPPLNLAVSPEGITPPVPSGHAGAPADVSHDAAHASHATDDASTGTHHPADDHDSGAGSHHDRALCLQCIAFGGPSLPGAPATETLSPFAALERAGAVFAASDSCHMLRLDAAQGCRGPPLQG